MQSGAKIRVDNGWLELFVMLALAGLAFVGAPIYVIVLGATALMFSSLHEYAYLQPRFAKAGAGRLMKAGILVAATLSLAFATLCFAVGRFFAWLIAA